MADDEEENGVEESSTAKKGGLMAPVLALVVVLLVAGGLTYAVTAALTAGEEPTDAESSVMTGKLWERAKAHSLGDIMANVAGEGGSRYVKVTVQIWVPETYHTKIAEAEITAILKETLEESLHSYTMDQLNREYIHSGMRTEFDDELNEQLRTIFGILDPEVKIVERVVLNNLMVQ